MKGFNKVSLIGNLGQPPEFKVLKGDLPVARFNIATTDLYKTKQGAWVSKTEWHNIIVWRGLAELARNFLKKGSMVFIEGKIQTRNFEGKQGEKRQVTEIIADQLIMLDKTTNKKERRKVE